jgi:hypothetical protein
LTNPDQIHSDSNIFYIITGKNIYKRFVSKPGAHIGTYLLSNYNFDAEEQIVSFSSVLSPDSTSDNNIIFSTYSSPTVSFRGRFSLFIDNINLQDIIENNINEFKNIVMLNATGIKRYIFS